MTAALRERYVKLLRWYPAAYRAERGAEIVDTYLDLAGSGQSWPRPADAADIMVGGLRQRLRARHSLGLADALPFAGALALTAAAALAAVWLSRPEGVVVPDGIAWRSFGPFTTLGALAWIAWLVAPVAALAGYGRSAVASALAVTIAVVPAAAVTPFARPPLFVLLPQVALGLVALAVPRRGWYRVTAVGAAAVAAVAGTTMLIGPTGFYYSLLDVLPYAGLGLVVTVMAAGAVFTVRRDPRAWWPGLILLGPVLLLGTTSLDTAGQPWPTWFAAVGWTVTSTLVASAAVLITVTLRARPAHQMPIPAGTKPDSWPPTQQGSTTIPLVDATIRGPGEAGSATTLHKD